MGLTGIGCQWFLTQGLSQRDLLVSCVSECMCGGEGERAGRGLRVVVLGRAKVWSGT